MIKLFCYVFLGLVSVCSIVLIGCERSPSRIGVEETVVEKRCVNHMTIITPIRSGNTTSYVPITSCSMYKKYEVTYIRGQYYWYDEEINIKEMQQELLCIKQYVIIQLVGTIGLYQLIRIK